MLDDRNDSEGSTGGDAGRPAPRARCPICRAPTQPAHRPFCSKRCADIDLHRWLSGVYRVPTDERADRDEDESGR